MRSFSQPSSTDTLDVLFDVTSIFWKTPMSVVQPGFSGEAADGSWNTCVDFLPHCEWADWRSELNSDIPWNCINLLYTHLPKVFLICLCLGVRVLLKQSSVPHPPGTPVDFAG